jgi:hypothetical protein
MCALCSSSLRWGNIAGIGQCLKCLRKLERLEAPFTCTDVLGNEGLSIRLDFWRTNTVHVRDGPKTIQLN